MSQKVVLVITDGIGYNSKNRANAFTNAKTPTYDNLFKNIPNSLVKTSGEAVGLPDGQMGNSEVGHMSIGSGRVIYQNLVKINKAIENHTLYNDTLKDLFDSSDTIHLIGLFSDGGVHSHMDHIIAMNDLCQKYNKKVFIHAITDGRDTAVQNGIKYIKNTLDSHSNINIATVSGRYYAMDRDSKWDRIEKAYDQIVSASNKTSMSPVEYMQQSYDNNITDEFIEPISFDGFNGIKQNDGIIFMNFRNDRVRQLSAAIGVEKFNSFKRDFVKTNVVTITEYDNKYPFKVLFAPENITNTLAEVISKHNLTQLHTAETEKYAHVTFYMNGGIEEPYPNEERALVPSPNIASYDLQPQMSAVAVCDEVLKGMEKSTDFIVVNFANGDMVGHTGDYEASIQAVECVDTQLNRIINQANTCGYSVIITSDHGNCEEMSDANGVALTNHTTYDVFCFVIDKRVKSLNNGTLANIAPTVLELMGIDVPSEMEPSLIKI